MHDLSDNLVFPAWVRAGLGGCAVGLIGLFLPVVLGEGYHSIHSMIEGRFEQGLVIVFLAMLWQKSLQPLSRWVQAVQEAYSPPAWSSAASRDWPITEPFP